MSRSRHRLCRVRALVALLVLMVQLAPGWFPVTALQVEGTHLLRADHGCACGLLEGCCCELFSRRGEAPAGASCHLRPRQASEHGSLCMKSGAPDRAPLEQRVTLDFRTFVAPLAAAMASRLPRPGGWSSTPGVRTPATPLHPPETPPPETFQTV